MRTGICLSLFWALLQAGVVHGASGPEPDLRTPAGTMAALLRAAQTADAHLWAKCVSRTDRPAIEAFLNPQERRRFEELRSQGDTAPGGGLGDDVFEYVLFQPVASVTGRQGLPENTVALAQILAENIWADSYAEVTLILPLVVKGVLPPMTFVFLKESDGWKLCQWLTSAIMLGWTVGRDPYFDATIRVLLQAHTGQDFDRGDCTRLKQRTFAVPPQVSAAYRAAVQGPREWERNQLLALWALTGDPEALPLVRDADAKDPKAGLGKLVEEYAKASLGLNPCRPRPATPTPETPVDPESPVFWYHTAENDIIALRALPDRFPKERSWGAKARLRIAYILTANERYEEAAAEYAEVVRLYPDQPDEAAEAKGRAAKLLWERLGRQDQAVALWRELKAAGRLPQDAVLPEGEAVIPVTLVQDAEKGYRRGIVDFDLLPDGGLLLLRLTERKAGRTAGGKGGAEPRLELRDAQGKFLSSLPDNKIEEIPHAMYRNGTGIFLETHSKLIRLSDRGAVIGELVNWFKNFEVKTGLHNGVYGSSTGESFPMAMWAADESFTVLYWGSLRTFDFQGALRRTVPVPFCDDWGNARGRMVGNAQGELVFTQPNQGKVFRVDTEGKLIPMRPPALPPAEFGSIVHLFADADDNLYLIDRDSRRVLEFKNDGAFIRSFFDAEINEPTSCAADEQGNVYVVGYGARGGETVTVFDKDTAAVSKIRIPTDSVRAGNGNILDIEVSGDGIYIVVGENVARADRSGRIVSSYRNQGRTSLAKDRQGKIYFPRGNAVWIYDGEQSHPLAEFPAGRPGQAIGSFAVTDRKVYGFAGAGGLLAYDRQSGQTEPVKPKEGKAFRCHGALLPDKEGNLFAVDLEQRGVHRIAPDGGEAIVLSGKASARKYWQPGDLALDARENLYVYDGANKSLLKFQPDGAFVAEFGLAKFVGGWVRRIRTDSAGRLYLLSDDPDKTRLLRFDLKQIFP